MALPYAKSESSRAFDAIARRYDLINTVLSGGLHRLWRKALRRELPHRSKQVVLDLATGTADVAIELSKDPKVSKIFGVDLSEGMLAVGRTKVAKLGLEGKIQLHTGDAQQLTYSGEQFDAVTMSFGIRNVPDVPQCLREIHRVLKPSGRALILEFGLPRSHLIRALHLFYLRHFLPRIGQALSGHGTAYSYLNQTIEQFPYGQDFVRLMKDAGFQRAGHRSLTFGIVNLYWGEKV